MFDHLQKITLKTTIEVWLSLVERYVRDVEVASSNLVTSTNLSGFTAKKAARLISCGFTF